MTIREGIWVAALVAAVLLVALGWAAFWPSWPPLPPGDHEAPPPLVVVEPEVERPAGKDTAGRHRPPVAAHRPETIGGDGGTVRLWPAGQEPPMAPHTPLPDEAQRLSWPDEVPPPRSLERER